MENHIFGKENCSEIFDITRNKLLSKIENVSREKKSLYADFLMKLSFEEIILIIYNRACIFSLTYLLSEYSKQNLYNSYEEFNKLCTKFRFLLFLSIGEKLGFYKVTYNSHTLDLEEWQIELTELGKNLAPHAPTDFKELCEFIKKNKVFSEYAKKINNQKSNL